jgi:hypothetical protein
LGFFHWAGNQSGLRRHVHPIMARGKKPERHLQKFVIGQPVSKQHCPCSIAFQTQVKGFTNWQTHFTGKRVEKLVLRREEEKNVKS